MNSKDLVHPMSSLNLHMRSIPHYLRITTAAWENTLMFPSVSKTEFAVPHILVW